MSRRAANTIAIVGTILLVAITYLFALAGEPRAVWFWQLLGFL